MIKIETYIEQTKEERQKHLNLNKPCDERGGNSVSFKGLLAYFLNTEIPNGFKILLCHACHNPKCSNAEHLYWGTPKENINDKKLNGTFKTVWEKMVEKYGLENAKKINGSGNKAAGGKGNKNKLKTEEHKNKIAESIKNKWSSGEIGSTRGS